MTDAARRKGPIPLRPPLRPVSTLDRRAQRLLREARQPTVRISYGALALMQLIGSALSLALGVYLGMGRM
jgi:hypothetical protein